MSHIALVDLAGKAWVKSSYSQNGGNCVEVNSDFPGLMPVRDSKDPAGPALVFSSDAWRSFVTAVQAGEFGTV
ncbi:DUF397 domain-containing protein [Kitasatospora sp. NPDC056327]|uniref:DUF397 domain-containing protein n=1 Tax=Kitasatospora sp. NPDC056327 TaxID=3345785 RepID=UPI0035E13B46